jgi:ABC-2 type transport system permease protein
MNFHPGRAMTIARREYVTTVRRKAFLFSLLLTPAIFGLSTMMQVLGTQSAAKEALRVDSMAVVDSSGEFATAARTLNYEVPALPGAKGGPAAPPEKRHTTIEFSPSVDSALAALRANRVQAVLVIPADYVGTGRLKRYKMKYNLISSADQRLTDRWLVGGLLHGRLDSLHAERAARPSHDVQVWTPDKSGVFELHDDKRDLLDIFVPLIFGMLLSIAIVTGGQYLLQGVSEEKESRILESLICTVSPSDLMVGKLVGLGGAGLTLVGAWLLMGSALAANAAVFMQFHPSILLLAFGLPFFLIGYLCYASLMCGIGAIASNLREAQQIALTFTMLNFVPMWAFWAIVAQPNAGTAVGLSMFPLTAPTAMMMRLAATNGGVPLWQVATSLAILATTAALAVFASSRIFRIGMLLYGKTPNLPEILRWVRQG